MRGDGHKQETATAITKASATFLVGFAVDNTYQYCTWYEIPGVIRYCPENYNVVPGTCVMAGVICMM